MNEISAEIQAELEKRYRTTAFVILAQIFFALVLTAAAWFIAQNADNSVTSGSLQTLWITVLFIALGTFFLRRIMFNWERLKNTAILKGVSGLLQTLQINAILLGAIAELIAVVGFLITTLSGNKWEMFRATAVALVVFLINFPRRKVWEKIVDNLANI